MNRLLPASIATLFSRRARMTVGARPTRPQYAAAADAGGPGWFESSWDLQSGLEVREASPDEVRLREWIDGLCLRAALQPEMAA